VISQPPLATQHHELFVVFIDAGHRSWRAPPTQTLNRTNHLAWKALVLPAFRGARVMGLILGTDKAPPETLEEDENKKLIEVPNPAYDTWIARDQQVLRFLLNSLSPNILSHVLSAESSAEAWSMIDGMFKTAARSKTQHLRSQLNDTKKLSLSADDYFTKMKGFASELAAVGKPLDDDELVGYLLRGLDKDHYNSLITNINGKADTTLDEFFGQLSSYDMRNGTGHGAHEGFTSSANIIRRGQENDRDRDYRPRARSPGRRDRGRQEYRGGGGGNFRRDRRDDTRARGDRDDRPRRRTDDRRQDSGKGRRRTDRAPTPFVDTTCQICNIYGHPAKDCWWRYGDDDDTDDRGSKGDKSANHASYGVDTNWYSDMGATDHITSELSKLTTHEKYT
jgi:hypothetical protein